MADNQIIEGVVAVIERDGRMLVIQRAPGIRAGGWWCFPGGGIEPGETPAEAIVREVREEIGLTIRAEHQLWEWMPPEGGLRLVWWKGHVLDGVYELTLDPAEVADARWMTAAEIRAWPKMLPGNLLFLDDYERNNGHAARVSG